MRVSEADNQRLEIALKQSEQAYARALQEIQEREAKARAAQQEVFDARMATYEAQLQAANETNKMIKEKIQKAEDELKALQASDPASYEQNEPVFFKNLMANIRGLDKVASPKPRVAFVGRTNAGKSSLINALYNVKCKVSPVECTMGYTVVNSTTNYDVVDVYGYNDKLPYYTKDQIDKFLALKAVVLLYTGSIQECERAIELFKATRVDVIVVRSKADNLTAEDLIEIERVEAKIAGEYGAAAWLATSIDQPATLQNLCVLIDAVTMA
jgi:GTP-binding protein EngB required for normal cell division